ncbi:MAG: DUF3883 domain-containing protein [Puniceicoccaceae bacterium]
MSGNDWSKEEVESIVEDYFSMLAFELAGVSYNKTAHRMELLKRLPSRSKGSIEFKHANVSAALLDLGLPYIEGYKPRSNYQELISEVLTEKLVKNPNLLNLAAADADRPSVVPEVDDILKALTDPPSLQKEQRNLIAEDKPRYRPVTNYLEREARNRSLGAAGELFVLNYERARLIHVGLDRLASKVEHTSKVRGDHEGYDILSFDDCGAERLIEVKTTKYGIETPFFITRNEAEVSKRNANIYNVYRLYTFSKRPKFYQLLGCISESCSLSPSTYLAFPRAG